MAIVNWAGELKRRQPVSKECGRARFARLDKLNEACPTMRCAKALSGQLSAFERHEIGAAGKDSDV
ncbi:MAG TPA: hypothetical protein VGE83_08150 [Terracidiphilus sp.]